MKLSYFFLFFFVVLPALIYGILIPSNPVEGYLLLASRHSQSEVPYKDFLFIFTPLTLFFTSFLTIISPALIFIRTINLIILITIAFFIKRIIFISTNNKLYSGLAFVLALSFLIADKSFLSIDNYALLFVVFLFYLLSKFLQTRNKKFLLVTGFVFTAITLTSQILGILLIIPIMIFFSIKSSRNFSYFYNFLIGSAWGIIIFAVYLLLTDSFRDFVNQLINLKSFEYIRLYQIISSNYKNFDIAVIFILFIFSICSNILLFIRRRFHLLPITSFILIYSFYLIVVKDYSDLSYLAALSGVTFAFYLRYNLSNNIRILILIVILSITALNFFNLYKYFYINKLRLTETIFNNNYKYNFYSENETTKFISGINKLSVKKDFIYIDDFAPEYYYLLERKDLAMINYFDKFLSEKKYYDRVIGNIIAKDIKIIFVNKNSNLNSEFSNFIKNNYLLHDHIGKYLVLVKKT